jgi:hypothetical protein
MTRVFEYQDLPQMNPICSGTRGSSSGPASGLPHGLRLHLVTANCLGWTCAWRLILLLVCAVILWGQENTVLAGPKGEKRASAKISKTSKTFEKAAEQSLLAMRQRAEALHANGVAVVAWLSGENATGWTSKMCVVGKLKNDPSASDPGANLLAIAYAKAAEMADTLKDSGSGVRPPMKGEFGWRGGVIRKAKTGYIIAAFSGASSEDDVAISQAGLEVLSQQL